MEFTVPTARLVDLLGAAASGGLWNLSYRLHGSAGWGWSGYPVTFDKRGDLDALRRLRDLLSPPMRAGYQPWVPGSPLKGPTTSGVTQPP